MTRIALFLCIALFATATSAWAKDGTADPKQADNADEPDDPSPLKREGEIVGLLQVTTQGVTEEAKEGFISSVENSLNLAGFRVVESKTLREYLADSAYVPGCTFGPCLKSVYAKTKVRLVVVARISGVGTSYSFVISLLDTQTGELNSQNAENCLGCTVDEALMQASNLVIGAVTGSGGAKVADRPAPMVPAPVPEDNPKARKASAKVGWVLFGLGVAAGAAGGYLLSSDDHDKMGYAAVAGGSAFAVSGLTVYLFSRSF